MDLSAVVAVDEVAVSVGVLFAVIVVVDGGSGGAVSRILALSCFCTDVSSDGELFAASRGLI